MSKIRHHWLTGLYPPAWRRRYGDEMDELLREGCGWREVFDVARAALTERLFYSERTGAERMQTFPGSIAVLVRKPSAITPIVMSMMALAVVVIAVGFEGVRRQPDEGAAAHLWQLLMVGQLPFLGWFGLHWLRRDLKAGIAVLGLQLAAFIAALLPVWLLAL